jgi:hypothetical protein
MLDEHAQDGVTNCLEFEYSRAQKTEYSKTAM